jgi:hypothetical protein
VNALPSSGARFPVHAVERCGGALVPLAAHKHVGEQSVFCTTCGDFFHPGAVVYWAALRAQRAGGLEAEPFTPYLARLLRALRASRTPRRA